MSKDAPPPNGQDRFRGLRVVRVSEGSGDLANRTTPVQ